MKRSRLTWSPEGSKCKGPEARRSAKIGEVGPLRKEICEPGRPESVPWAQLSPLSIVLAVAWGQGSPPHQTWITSC